MKQPIHTDAAPSAIGPYSQAVRAGNTVYVSGQIPLDPATGEVVAGDFADRAHRVFANLKAIAEAAGTDLDHAVKVTIFLTDLGQFAAVNAVMEQFFRQPFPARAAVQVSALPKGVDVEADAVLVIE